MIDIYLSPEIKRKDGPGLGHWWLGFWIDLGFGICQKAHKSRKWDP